MIAKEAIETLKANYPDACYEQLREAVDAAIEALKAQGVAGDTIYRQTAIDAMYKILHDYFWANDEELDAVITTLNDLPSARSGIIQCKDCRYWDKNKENGYLPGHHYCVMIEEEHKGDFYCGYAKRRTDG